MRQLFNVGSSDGVTMTVHTVRPHRPFSGTCGLL